tara:strand:- start:2204 stop:3148 length:945 start_codon:yes stop_codon:yes gene_type:complete
MADIPISSTARRVQFTGNTTTGPFAFGFNILADSDLIVIKNTTTLTLTSDYTITTNANGTGLVTLDSALVASDRLTIIGGRTLERTTDFVTAGDLLASSLNEQLDSLVIMAQQLDEKVGRAIIVNAGDESVSLEMPTKDNRKGTVLAFNATTGAPEAGPTIADVSTVAAITADISTLADIEDGTTATDAISGLAAIKTNVTTVAGISSNVTSVASNATNINAVAADATDIGAVAGSISNVNTLAGISTSVAACGAISSDITAVANDATDIGIVGASIANVNLVASSLNSGALTAINDYGSVANAVVTTNDYGSV